MAATHSMVPWWTIWLTSSSDESVQASHTTVTVPPSVTSDPNQYQSYYFKFKLCHTRWHIIVTPVSQPHWITYRRPESDSVPGYSNARFYSGGRVTRCHAWLMFDIYPWMQAANDGMSGALVYCGRQTFFPGELEPSGDTLTMPSS